MDLPCHGSRYRVLVSGDPFQVPDDLVDAAPAQRHLRVVPEGNRARHAAGDGMGHAAVFLQMELDATRHGRRAGVMDDEARTLLDDVKRRNADIQWLTENDLEADALVAVALTKLGEEAVDSLAKEALGSAHRAEEGKALFKLRLRALFPDTGGA